MDLTLDRFLDQLDPHCDVRRRSADVPRSARVRGVFFNNIDAVLEREGRLETYRSYFPDRKSTLRWYPAGDYLVNLAVAGALLTSPDRVHAGMEEIGRRYAVAISESLLGRVLLRFLDRDPRRILQQGVAARRQTYSYGHWTLEFDSPRSAIMHFADEYMWIESNLVGAARGTFEAIDLEVAVRAELDSAYAGRHFLSW